MRGRPEGVSRRLSFWGGDGQPAYIKAPMIPGHEFVARLVKVGSKIKGFKEGDRVTSEQIVPCWDCKFCNSGRYWMCQKHDLYGFQNNVNGGMAEYIKFPKEALVYHVPEELPTEKAILIEPYACSKHCVDRAQIRNEDVVVLSGVGTLGLGMLVAILQCNPDKLIVLDMMDKRLELAKEFGAEIVMNPGKEDVVQKVLDMTDGYGCDIYIEATGHPSSVIQGLSMVRKLGRFVEFSVFKDSTTIRVRCNRRRLPVVQLQEPHLAHDQALSANRPDIQANGGHAGVYADLFHHEGRARLLSPCW